MRMNFLFWIAATRHGFTRPADWQRWAVQCITELPFAPPWLATLLDTEDPEEAAAAFITGWVEHRKKTDEESDYPLHMGFLWLAHEVKGRSLMETLMDAGDLADRANGDPCCEEFYMLANEIDGGGPVRSGPFQYSLEERAAQLFAPYVAITLNACAGAGIEIPGADFN